MKAIADKKKQHNIGEYILYMYQMEDLLRAYELNLDDIRQYVVSHYPISEKEKEEAMNWFEELCEDMKSQNITERGHLLNTQKLVYQLAELHWSLLKRDKDYFIIYQKAKPYVFQLVMEAGTSVPGNEIQICINAVYGLLLARLKGRDVPQSILEATDAFGNVLSYLNWVYFKENKDMV
ncbi:DUF4924 family protein [Shivajiella indica]|uniref:DUF4924 family protein n=1 Tax=Shivajiella indica TaxID=872115 RepID=A0ABW5BBV5_9BACT